MRSMHIIGSRRLGGAESFFMRLVLGLAEEGDQVASLSRASSLVARELGERVTQFHAPMLNPFDLWSRRMISRAVRSWEPEIVQTYMTRATVLTRLPRGGKPVHIARLGGYYKVANFRHAHVWVGNTKGICDYLLQAGLPAQRVHYIGNFVGQPETVADDELLRVRSELGLPQDSLLVVAAGRFVRKKGFDVFLDALSQLPAQIDGRPIHAAVVGDGGDADFLRLEARRLGLGGRLHWPGWQTKLGPFYSLADLFVCPSRREPLGNVILEAWTYGKPVVSTDTDGAKELITPGEDAEVVPVDDAHALGAAMKALLQDSSRRSALAAGGARTVAKFSQRAILDAYRDLYRDLLRG